MDLAKEEFYKKIIFIVKNEIINLAKSENMIDLRTPSFINTKFDLNKKNNLVELNNRIKKIDLIENIYVQEFNNKNVFLKNQVSWKNRQNNQTIERPKYFVRIIR